MQITLLTQGNITLLGIVILAKIICAMLTKIKSAILFPDKIVP